MKLIRNIWPYPIHALLIPLFFLLHNYNEFYNIVDFNKLAVHIVVWMLSPILLIFIYLFVYKNLSKASLITSVLLILFFFIGPLIKESRDIPYLNYLFKYSVLIPSLLFGVFFLHFRLHKSEIKQLRTHYFIATTFLLLISYELLFYFTIIVPDKRTYNMLRPSIPDLTLATVSQHIDKPDIYFLLFDEMPSTNSLKTLFQYNNTHIADSLTKLGFTVSTEAQSAYPSTPLSIASIFNLQNLGFPADTTFSFKDYAKADISVQKNQLFPFLKRNGYSCVNASIFNINDYPSPVRIFINLPKYVTWGVQENMIKNQTLFNRMHEDIGWNFTSWHLNQFVENLNRDLRNEIIYTNRIRSMIDSCLHSPGKQPLFFYGHFFLPHLPYKFDSSGTGLQWTVSDYKARYKNKENYLAQVKYAGKLICELARKIVTESKKPAIIIIQGDHGFRENDKKHVSFSHNVSVFSSIYFPDKDYTRVQAAFYSPNTFRIILDKYFNVHLPLIKNPNNFEHQTTLRK